MSRWTLESRGAGVTSTPRPMIDASIRRAPLINAPRSTIEYSISLSSIVQSSATEVNGPTYDPLTRVPAPMMAGPTMREAVTSAPFSITTRPMSSHPGCTTPRCTGSAVSSTSRLTSSKSATLPVSFQYPEMVVDATVRP